MAILLILLTLITAWLLSNTFSLINNYRLALASNLPILIGLGNTDNYLWIVFSVPLRRTIEKYTSESFYNNYFKATIYGWEFRDKNAVHENMHEKYGPMFLLVSAGETELWIADPTAAQSVLMRRKDFMQSKQGIKVMEALGPNMITSDGDSWARQRRLIAPNLNERISEVVWTESTIQASTMIHHLLSQRKGETNTTLEGLRSIALNVLGQAGYGESQEWNAGELVSSEDSSMTFFDAVSKIIPMVIIAAIFPTWLLRLGLMPKKLRDVGEAVDKYPGHAFALIDKEKNLAIESGEERNNFITMMARLSDGDEKIDAKSGLTPGEIQGNLFIFTVAGFDTTANTLAYAVTTLATRPDLQNWLFEELDHVLPSDSAAEIDYKASFPKLIRCLAFMYETLRVYPAVIHIARSIHTDQSIETRKGSHLIKGPAKVYVNAVALHSDTATWGADALAFKPERWFVNTNTPPPPYTSSPTAEVPEFITPPKGTYIPWSGGPRVCPGMKMAQVEFVAVIATLFKSCRVEVVLREGESELNARERLVKTMQESQPLLTLQIEKPEDIVLRWVKR
ncbi:cytochrome P450 [Venturia nashicola]|uniref:Cytochrome P450 n=1 Tax=Venturia nashicola TaxID=86259 RepID=A0A4Z1PE52_9PEZI|nr:cytochrome P450 [Venturia nashicola]